MNNPVYILKQCTYRCLFQFDSFFDQCFEPIEFCHSERDQLGVQPQRGQGGQVPRQEPRGGLRRRRRRQEARRPQGHRHRPRLQRRGQAEVGTRRRGTRVAPPGVVFVVIGGSGPVSGAGLRAVHGK